MAKLSCYKDSKSREKVSFRQGYVTKTLLNFEDNERGENQRIVRQKFFLTTIETIETTLCQVIFLSRCAKLVYIYGL